MGVEGWLRPDLRLSALGGETPALAGGGAVVSRVASDERPWLGVPLVL
jgi:hypothetical protein